MVPFTQVHTERNKQAGLPSCPGDGTRSTHPTKMPDTHRGGCVPPRQPEVDLEYCFVMRIEATTWASLFGCPTLGGVFERPRMMLLDCLLNIGVRSCKLSVEKSPNRPED